MQICFAQTRSSQVGGGGCGWWVTWQNAHTCKAYICSFVYMCCLSCIVNDGPGNHVRNIGPYCYLHLWGRSLVVWTLTPGRTMDMAWVGLQSNVYIICKSIYSTTVMCTAEWHVQMYTCADNVLLCCGVLTLKCTYPEGGSKEIKEESYILSLKASTNCNIEPIAWFNWEWSKVYVYVWLCVCEGTIKATSCHSS